MPETSVLPPNDERRPTIGNRIAKGARWTIGIRIAERVIGLTSTMILARLLVPGDFGLIAMGTAVLAALEAMTAFGFEWAVIQRGTRERRFLDTAWTLNLIFAVVCAVLLCAAVPIVTLFYGEPRVAEVMYVLALVCLIGGLRNIGMVIFERELEFRPIFLTALTSKLCGLVVTVTIAHFHPSHWALLAGICASRLTDLIMTYTIQPYRPRWSLESARELFGFSGWLLLNNILFFLSNRGADFIVGSRAGSTALGMYSVSYELANLPTTELVHPVMRATFPGYSQLKEDRDELAAVFLKVLGLVAIFTLPAAGGLAFLALPVVNVLLGEKWLDAATLIPPLALAGAFRALQGTTNSVYVAIGKPRFLTGLTAIYVVLGLTSFSFLLITYSPEVAVWGLAAASALVAMLNLALISRELAITTRSILAEILRPFVATALMTGILAQLPSTLWNDGLWGGQLALLLAAIAVGVGAYFAFLSTVWALAGRPEGAERVAFELMRNFLPRRR